MIDINDNRIGAVLDEAGAHPSQRTPRRSPSHISQVEWSGVILVVCLVLSYLFNHLACDGRAKVANWQAEDARMQAAANKP